MNSLRAILKKREMTSFLCLVLLFIVVGCINPAFFTVGNISACFNSSVVFVIISVGMAFTIMIGEIDVSVGSCMGMTAGGGPPVLWRNVPSSESPSRRLPPCRNPDRCDRWMH